MSTWALENWAPAGIGQPSFPPPSCGGNAFFLDSAQVFLITAWFTWRCGRCSSTFPSWAGPKPARDLQSHRAGPPSGISSLDVSKTRHLLSFLNLGPAASIVGLTLSMHRGLRGNANWPTASSPVPSKLVPLGSQSNPFYLRDCHSPSQDPSWTFYCPIMKAKCYPEVLGR